MATLNNLDVNLSWVDRKILSDLIKKQIKQFEKKLKNPSSRICQYDLDYRKEMLQKLN